MDGKSLSTAYEAAWNPDHQPIPPADPWGRRGAYTTMLVEGRPPMAYFMDRHLRRLNDSIRHLGLHNPFPETFLRGRIETAAANLAAPCMLRMAIVEDGLFLTSYPQTGNGAELLGRPCRARRKLPAAKSLLDTGLYQDLQQVDRNCEELLLISEDQHVLEGGTTNLLLVQGHRIHTPSLHTLPGITRQVIEENLPRGWSWAPGNIHLDELPGMDEILACGSGKEVARITRLEGIDWSPVSDRAFRSISQAYATAKNQYRDGTAQEDFQT